MKGLTFKLDAKTVTLKVIDAAIKAIAPKDILVEASSVILDSTRKRFRQAVDPTGKPWPVSKSAKARARGVLDSEGVTGGGKTLFSTGALFHSIGVFASRGDSIRIGVKPNAEQIRRRGKRRVIKVRSYAGFHQSGVGGQVKRKFLGVTKQDVTAVNEFLSLRLKQHGG